MTPSPHIKFRSLPRTYLPYASGGEDAERVKVEIEIKEGEVARFLTLPDFFSGYLTVHLDEGDTEGLPGNFFIVRTLGRSEATCGGYIGEHRGPKTLVLWFANRSMSPVTLGGAVGIEPVEAVKQENERAQQAAAWEERKEKAFQAVMRYVPVVMSAITARTSDAMFLQIWDASIDHILVKQLRSLLATFDPPQLSGILAVLNPDQQKVLVDIISQLNES